MKINLCSIQNAIKNITPDQLQHKIDCLEKRNLDLRKSIRLTDNRSWNRLSDLKHELRTIESNLDHTIDSISDPEIISRIRELGVEFVVQNTYCKSCLPHIEKKDQQISQF